MLLLPWCCGCRCSAREVEIDTEHGEAGMVAHPPPPTPSLALTVTAVQINFQMVPTPPRHTDTAFDTLCVSTFQLFLHLDIHS